MTSRGDLALHFSRSLKVKSFVSKRHLSGTVCSLQVLFHSPYGNVLTFVLSGGNSIDRKQKIRLWTFLSECKTLSNSTEIYNLIKDSCKHVPYSPVRKTKKCTMKANFVCLLSEFLGTAMYQEGQ